MGKTGHFFETGVAAESEAGEYAYPASLAVLPDCRLMAAFTWIKPIDGTTRTVCCGIYSNDGGRTWTKTIPLFDEDSPFTVRPDEPQNFADPNITVFGDRIYLSCVSLGNCPGKLDLSSSRIWYRTSQDGGRTWSDIMERCKHKKYISGMVHPGLILRNGAAVIGYAWDNSVESGALPQGEGEQDYHAGVFITEDEGNTWRPFGDIHIHMKRKDGGNEQAISGADEPAIVELEDGTLYMLVRTGTEHLWETRSYDGGITWLDPQPSPLTSHNCPAALLKLREGGVIAVYNDHPIERARLCVRLSDNECLSWGNQKVFAPAEFNEEPEASYPAVSQTLDGTIVVVWCQKRRVDPKDRFKIHIARFNRDWILS